MEPPRHQAMLFKEGLELGPSFKEKKKGHCEFCEFYNHKKLNSGDNLMNLEENSASDKSSQHLDYSLVRP